MLLKGEDSDAQVIVSPKYQGKVFTSTATNLKGTSFGWVNYRAFSAPVDQHMNAYGGENRFWLGRREENSHCISNPALKWNTKTGKLLRQLIPKLECRKQK